MDKGYGQKAPRLEDGTMLLSEVELTPEQTRAVRRDGAVFNEARTGIERLRRRIAVISAVLMVLVMANMFSLFWSPLPFYLHNAIAVVLFAVIFYLNARSRSASRRLLPAALDVLSASPGLAVSRSVSEHFNGESDDRAVWDYVALLSRKEVELGEGSRYLLKLDTSADERYVLRSVQTEG